MPVDAEIRKILDMVAALPAPDYVNTPGLELARRLRATVPPPPVIEDPVDTEERAIPGPHGEIPIKIYRPAGTGPFGAVVSFHGGGWVLGSIGMDEYRNHELVKRSGCAVVSVDYRLAPEFPYPVPLDDCYAATEWTVSHAGALALDPARIGLAGSSAGGNLAIATALMARDRQGPALKCMLLSYPVCDDDFERPSYRQNAEGYLLTRQQMQWFWDQYAPPAQRAHPYVSPLKADDLSGLPPAWVITAEYDPLRDEAEDFAAKLRAAGVAASHRRYGGVIHGFLSAAPQLAASQAALDESAAVLRAHLGVPGASR